MAIIQDIENSAYIQALKQEFAEAQAAGASQDYLLSIHAKAQDYREQHGYTANLDGSQFTVIDSYEPVSAPAAVQQINPAQSSDSNGSVAGSGAKIIQNIDTGSTSNLQIGNGNISQYIKFAVVGLVGLTFLDIVFGGNK